MSEDPIGLPQDQQEARSHRYVGNVWVVPLASGRFALFGAGQERIVEGPDLAPQIRELGELQLSGWESRQMSRVAEVVETEVSVEDLGL